MIPRSGSASDTFFNNFRGDVRPPIHAFLLLLTSPRAQLTRIYAEPLLACVADNRKMMRDAAIAALEKVTTSGGERLSVHP